MEEETASQILHELRKQNRLCWLFTGIALILVCVYVYLQATGYTPHSSPPEPTWKEVRSLLDKAQYSQALEMTRALVEKSPKYYYGYSLLGEINMALGNVGEAERNFTKAYNLFPIEENEKDLLAAKKLLRERGAD